MFTYDLQVNNNIGCYYQNEYKIFIDNVMGEQKWSFYDSPASKH